MCIRDRYLTVHTIQNGSAGFQFTFTNTVLMIHIYMLFKFNWYYFFLLLFSITFTYSGRPWLLNSRRSTEIPMLRYIYGCTVWLVVANCAASSEAWVRSTVRIASHVAAISNSDWLKTFSNISFGPESRPNCRHEVIFVQYKHVLFRDSHTAFQSVPGTATGCSPKVVHWLVKMGCLICPILHCPPMRGFLPRNRKTLIA